MSTETDREKQEYDDFDRGTINFRAHLMRLADFMRPRNRLIAGQLYVLARDVDETALAIKQAWPDPAPSDERAPRVAARGGEHRHKFGADGRCTVPGCARVKGAAGRKPAAGAASEADTRTAPLPLGEAAADRFAGGGLGSSGVQRR